MKLVAMIAYEDIGIVDYREAWDFQQKKLDEIVELKKTESFKNSNFAGWFYIVEHPHVYTLGKSGDEQNMLLNYLQLQAKNAQFIYTNRGGDITYHGPGQIVGYPIIDLEKLNLSVKKYIFLIEEAVILSMDKFGIACSRLDGATGVWIEPNSNNARKICAIGVRVSRFVTMHGFALNVNTDLSYFSHINPCGFTDKAVTSMEKELNCKQNIDNVKIDVFNNFIKLLKK